MMHDMIYDAIRYDMTYDTIYLLTAIGLPPGGSCTVHIYTQTIHRTTQNKQYIKQQKIDLTDITKEGLKFTLKTEAE
jgi:hypothetical protein